MDENMRSGIREKAKKRTSNSSPSGLQPMPQTYKPRVLSFLSTKFIVKLLWTFIEGGLYRTTAILWCVIT